MKLAELLKKEFVILDGAMGTVLQDKGVDVHYGTNQLNLSNPQVISEIHRDYLEAGSNIVYANTFTVNDYKLAGSGHTVEELIEAGIKAAREAVKGTDCLVGVDIGPIGEMLEPTGTLKFEDAYGQFKKIAICAQQAGADMIALETMTDLYEVKAAVLACKENSDLPIFVTMSFEQNGRTFTGCTVESMAMTLEGLGVDAIGLNCSLGPKEVYPIVKRLCETTNLPVIVKPNAGLPDPNSNTYTVSPEDFAEQMLPFAALGVQMMGGCCGTSPEYIRCLKKALSTHKRAIRSTICMAGICTPTRPVYLDRVRVIGERINPTGKKLFKQALQNDDMDYILHQGVSQADAGADILDVNVGLPGLDEVAMMKKVVRRLQATLDLPLQIDSNNPEVLEAALRIYNGKAIVNSVNGEDAVLDKILPIVKKYGASVVGLTLDEKGIPESADARFAIAQKIVEQATSLGIKREDVYIDCLTLTVSAQQEQALETLTAIRMVKERLGVKTVLGVSNISFGLPCRELMNQNFLAIAMAYGLDLPIINPNVDEMMDAVRAYLVLSNHDVNAQQYIETYAARAVAQKAEKTATPVQAVNTTAETQSQDPHERMNYCISRGLKEDARALTKDLLSQMDEMSVVDGYLIPALDVVGADFEKGTLFLPQLIQAAQAAQGAFEVIKELLASQNRKNVSKGKIIVATVKGDIHDIGKNIVKVILENYGYTILDLGRDVPPEAVVNAVIEQQVKLVGLSALMTTTLGSMQQTIEALRDANCDCKVFVGGAVLTPDYAAKIGADFYAKDAKESVDIAKRILG